MEYLLVDAPCQDRSPSAEGPANETLACGYDPSRLLMRVLDEIDYGLMLLGEAAQMRFANRVALRECASGVWVHLCKGALCMRQNRDQEALLKALGAARHGARSLLQLASSDETQMVAVVPLDELTGTATLLVFGKRQMCEPLSIDFFARTHGLSNAEGAVLRALCSGLFPEQVAQHVGVAISTVRTQIGSIRTKTGTHSIRELIGRVTTLPPLVSILQQRGTFGALEVERSAA